MVSVHTNENNPATLKILVALKYAKKQVELRIVNLTDKGIAGPKILPYLKIGEYRNVFIANAAARYLYPPTKEQESATLEWLEWESTLLVASIAHIGNASRLQKLKPMIAAHLKYLNDNVTGKFSLTGESISVCDIAIWSTLYPLYNDGSLVQEYLSELPNLLDWLKRLGHEIEFKEALRIFPVAPGVTSYNALASGAGYLSPSIISVNESSSINQSPQHSEAVTSEELKQAKEAWFSGLDSLPQLKKDVNPVLPVAGETNVLITSALPYVNNVPHLGNIIGCVLSADVFARFCRLCNYNTLYICGTDEYGTATETKALEEGLTPQQICDKYFEVHNAIYRWFNIGFDYFGRTTTPEQTALVQDIFLVLNENGFMHTESVEQLLCENCNRYLADRFVEGGCPHLGCNYEDARGDQCDGCGKLVNAIDLKNPRCKMCSKSPVVKNSHQYFLDLPKLEPLLLHWMEKSSPGWSNNARVIAKSWMREGLKPRCITRDLKWGVPVPLEGFKEKVFYVWFDAPIGYMSISQRYSKEWEKWWRPAEDTKVSLYQFMAKDNVPFHSVMFPAVCLGTNRGYVTVSNIMATEYLNYEDGKFSKSRGIGVFGNDAQDTGIHSDVWRFYLLYLRPENQDSSFSWVDLATKNNSELLNNLGNFVNRALVFAEKNFNGTIPAINPTEEDYTLLALCTRELKGYVACLEKAKLRDGIRHILSISRFGNQYMQSTQPWVLLKGGDAEKIRAGTIIGICCNIACLLSTLLFPYMPETSRTLKQQLNAPHNLSVLIPTNPIIVNLLPPGHKIGKPAPLFLKIDSQTVEDLKKRFAGKQQTNDKPSDVTNLEDAIKKQGDKVRTLKSSGVDKSVWQPEVTMLLDLKKQLESANKLSNDAPKPTSVVSQNGAINQDDVKNLEQEIEKQGLLVRKLKESGAQKTEWQPQVDLLLQLKGKLAVKLGQPLATPGKGKKGKK